VQQNLYEVFIIYVLSSSSPQELSKPAQFKVKSLEISSHRRIFSWFQILPWQTQEYNL
jgi:hypothetical protein